MNELELVPGGWGGNANRARYLKHIFITYKLGQQDFEVLWEKQAGKCLGCRITFAHPWVKGSYGVRCQVDHKHIKGERCVKEDVRSLLCGTCNKWLHRYEDRGVLSEAQLEHKLKMLSKRGVKHE